MFFLCQESGGVHEESQHVPPMPQVWKVEKCFVETEA